MAAECELMRWVVNKEIMPLYIDTARFFVTLSSGALVLTIVFYEKIVGIYPGQPVNRTMVVSWLLYLLTIGASAAYQYLAVRFLDSVSCYPAGASKIPILKDLIQAPGQVYGAMLILFVAASTLLVVAAWRQLPMRGTLISRSNKPIRDE